MGTAKTNKKISKNNKEPHKYKYLICCWVLYAVGVLVIIAGFFVMVVLPILLGDFIFGLGLVLPGLAIMCAGAGLFCLGLSFYDDFIDQKTQRKNDDETATQNSNGGKIAKPEENKSKIATTSDVNRERPEWEQTSSFLALSIENTKEDNVVDSFDSYGHRTSDLTQTQPIAHSIRGEEDEENNQYRQFTTITSEINNRPLSAQGNDLPTSTPSKFKVRLNNAAVKRIQANSRNGKNTIEDMTNPINGSYAARSLNAPPSRPGGSPSNG